MLCVTMVTCYYGYVVFIGQGSSGGEGPPGPDGTPGQDGGEGGPGPRGDGVHTYIFHFTVSIVARNVEDFG